MSKKTPHEEQQEAYNQRKLGERGISTGSAHNSYGLQDHQARQAKAQRDQANHDQFVKTAQKTAGTSGCALSVITLVVILTIAIVVIGPAVL